MISSPLVSVIIPAYHGQQRIARAVKSIFQQDYTNWEIVIISDDMSDYEKVLADQGIRSDKIVFCSTEAVASGEGNARNIGLENAKGDFVIQLDCDDACHPERISKMLPLAKEYGAAISNIAMIDEKTGLKLANFNKPAPDDKVFPEQVIRCSFHTMNVAMFDRNKITHRYHHFKRYADYIFLMQMFNVIPCIGYCNEKLYDYYKYEGSITNFSSNPDEIARSFTELAQEIKFQVGVGSVELKSPGLKEIVCGDMDLWIGAQEYFVASAAHDPQLKFHEIIGPFLEQWPLPASLLAAR